MGHDGFDRRSLESASDSGEEMEVITSAAQCQVETKSHCTPGGVFHSLGRVFCDKCSIACEGSFYIKYDETQDPNSVKNKIFL